MFYFFNLFKNMSGVVIAISVTTITLIVIGLLLGYWFYRKCHTSDLDYSTKSPFITSDSSLTGGKSFF